MRTRTIVTLVITMLAMILPSTASAAICDKGISNGVSVASPQKVAPGQTQGQHYLITACTPVARVTVEWVRIINSGMNWLYFPNNRTTVIAEASQGTSMQGATSWVLPRSTPAGHYAVITRYYTVGSSAPEDIAGSSFIVSSLPDVCPDLAGVQIDPPAGTIAPDCLPDVCPSMSGIQTVPPAGTVAPDCLPDVCPAITGIQTAPPAGTTAPACKPDVCPTIQGVQTEPPAGTTAPVCHPDVCPALAGIQIVVEPACNPVIITDPPKTCPNILTLTLEQATKDGLTIDGSGNCVEKVIPTGTVGNPKLAIFKAGNKKRVKQGGTVMFTIKVRNTGSADAGKTRVCDFLPAGMVYVRNSGTAYFSAGKLCWTLNSISKGKTVTVGTVTVRIVKNRGRVVNVACIMRSATTGTARKVCATAPVVVTPKPEPTGGVTG